MPSKPKHLLVIQSNVQTYHKNCFHHSPRPHPLPFLRPFFFLPMRISHRSRSIIDVKPSFRARSFALESRIPIFPCQQHTYPPTTPLALSTATSHLLATAPSQCKLQYLSQQDTKRQAYTTPHPRISPLPRHLFPAGANLTRPFKVYSRRASSLPEVRKKKRGSLYVYWRRGRVVIRCMGLGWFSLCVMQGCDAELAGWRVWDCCLRAGVYCVYRMGWGGRLVEGCG